jgi:hypothetical protein
MELLESRVDWTHHGANVVSIAARLDRLQHRTEHGLDGPPRRGPGLA